eukprot:TRINITY_DN20_c1_g1_i2.p1 TRINITY_DN20_c1_g1~~TRINITY_DN20_c1_g1_i2.p1  ORF type:complete len:1680 (-),score=654.35 TRINITY_DN20_c1_g1_i2:38-4906(-)
MKDGVIYCSPHYDQQVRKEKGLPSPRKVEEDQSKTSAPGSRIEDQPKGEPTMKREKDIDRDEEIRKEQHRIEQEKKAAQEAQRIKQAEEERIKQQEEDQRKKAEEEARLKREDDERIKREAERIKQQEEDQRKKAEEEARLKREDDERIKREAERIKQEELDRKRKQDEEEERKKAQSPRISIPPIPVITIDHIDSQDARSEQTSPKMESKEDEEFRAKKIEDAKGKLEDIRKSAIIEAQSAHIEEDSEDDSHMEESESSESDTDDESASVASSDANDDHDAREKRQSFDLLALKKQLEIKEGLSPPNSPREFRKSESQTDFEKDSKSNPEALSKFFGVEVPPVAPENVAPVVEVSTPVTELVEEPSTSEMAIPSLDLYVERRSMRKSSMLSSRQVPVQETHEKRVVNMEEKVRKKWEKAGTRIPVAADLAKLIPHVEIMTVQQEVVWPEKDTGPQHGIPFQITKKFLKSFLETLAIQLGDTKETLSAIIEQFDINSTDNMTSDEELGTFLKTFVTCHLGKDVPTMKVLRCLSQSMISPPFVQLKDQFLAVGCAFVDIANTWKISITIGPGDGSESDVVTIAHSKGAQSVNSKSTFQFVWQFELVFSRNMKEIKKMKLSIPIIEFSDEFPKEQKDALRSLVKDYDENPDGNSKEIPEKSSQSSRIQVENPNQRSLSQTTSSSRINKNQQRASTRFHEPTRVETRGEQKFVEDLLGKRHRPLYMQWGQLVGPIKTKDRLLVVGACRVYVIRRNNMGKKKIARQAHLFDMKEVTTLDPNQIRITFHHLELDFRSEGVGDAVPMVLLPAHQKICFGFPSQFQVKFNANRNMKIPTVKPGPARGFIDTYRACCDFHNLPVSKSFVVFAEQLAMAGNRRLKLSDCPGLETGREYSFDMLPIASALQYNSYFRSIESTSTPRKDAVAQLSRAIEMNPSLSKLILSGFDTDAGWDKLGWAIRDNRRSILTTLNLSFNNIKDKAMVQLCEGIQNNPHLTDLNFAKANLTSTGIIHLIRAIGANFKISSFLRHLNISYNDCGTYGSAALANWLSTRKKEKPGAPLRRGERILTACLRSLNMSCCGLEIFAIFKELRESVFGDLISDLQISGNKVDRVGTQELCTYIAGATSLAKLGMSNCNMDASHVPYVLQSIKENGMLDSVEIDISENNLGNSTSSGVEDIAAVLADSQNITGISLRSNNLKVESLVHVITAVAFNLKIKNLNLSENKIGKSSEAIIKPLQNLFSTSGLTELNLEGGQYGKHLGIVLAALSEKSQLLKLNLTNNFMGDQAAVQLAQAVKISKLIELYWDGNHVTIDGFQAMRDALRVNKTLEILPAPQNDINRAIAEAKDKDGMVDRISTVMLHIKQSLARNNLGISSIKSVGISDDMNPGQRESMEDAHVFIDRFNLNPRQCFIGIYDGHGGDVIAEYVGNHFHKIFAEELQVEQDPKEAFKKAYAKMDKKISDRKMRRSGSTAVTAYIHVTPEGDRILYTANIGDARAVLNRGGDPIRLTFDHKASEESEQKRIKDMNCYIIGGRLAGSLAVTRAFGDLDFKNAGLISDPFISETPLTSEDRHLIVACDGLWDVMSDEEVCRECGDEVNAQKISDDLLFVSMDRGTKDNVSVIVVTL